MADEVVAISFGGAYECGADKVLNITVPEGLTVDSAVETVNAAFDAENPEVVLVEACRHMKVIAGSLAFHADTAVALMNFHAATQAESFDYGYRAASDLRAGDRDHDDRAGTARFARKGAW